MFFSLQSSSTPKCQKDLCLGHDFNSFASYFLPRHLLEFVWQTCFRVDYLKLGIFYYLSFDHVRKKATDTVVENISKSLIFPKSLFKIFTLCCIFPPKLDVWRQIQIKGFSAKIQMRLFRVIFRQCVSAKIYLCVNSRSFRHCEICQSQFISTYFDAFVGAK